MYFLRTPLFLFLVAVLLCISLMLRNRYVGIVKGLSGRPRGYSVEEAKSFFDHLDKNSKATAYAISELTLDILFPVVYMGLFLSIWLRLNGNKNVGLFITASIVLAEIGENSFLSWLALSEFRPNLAATASLFTRLKWIGISIACLTLLLCWVFQMLKVDK